MRLVVPLLALVAACADAPATDLDPRPAPAIVVGADGVGHDRADTACAIVLREVARVPDGRGGFVTSSPDGRLVWDGTLDVARATADAALGVAVLFQTPETRGAWFAAPATRVGDDGPLARYTFRIDAFTPRVGTSTTSLARTVIRLAPFVATADGGRLFDHNRVPDPLAAYELTAANQWSLAADGACPAADDAVARWSFTYPDFAETLVGGPLRAGARVRIAYDGRRLRETQGCMGAHGAASGTTLYVSYMIDGDPARAGRAEVERYTISAGAVRQEVFEPVIDLPVDASDLAVWFSCVPGFDAAPNVRYDSDDGRNYHAAIVASPRVDWIGAWGLFRARAGDVLALPDPLAWSGFTNMGLAVQVELWSADAAPADLQVFVESDALACDPGGALTRERLPLAATGAGPFGNNAVFRWGFEPLLGRCPAGDYRFRVVASADGGLTFTSLGATAEATADAPDPTLRALHHRGPR